MVSTLKLYSTDYKELKKFLSQFFIMDIQIDNEPYWEKNYGNPLDMVDLISALVDNSDEFTHINMWVSIDPRYLY